MKIALTWTLAAAASCLLCPVTAAQSKADPIGPSSADGDTGAQVEASAPNDWFQATSIDLGTFLEDETATGEMKFKNPHGDVTHRLKRIEPSCTCSKAIIHVGGRVYRIENDPAPNTIYRVETADGVEKKEAVQFIAVGPGESGKVEVQLDLRNASGVKTATISVQTSDEDLPLVNLKVSATAATYFTVVPPEINLNKMTWKDERDFTIHISSPMRDDFEITGLDDLPNQMKIEYEKEMRDGKALWVVKGKYGPNVDPQAGGGILNFKTDLDDKEVTVRVMAWVQGPLEVRPGGFLPLGMIRRGKGVTKVIEFEANDEFDLQVVEMHLKNLSIPEEFVTVVSKKDGKILKVELSVSPDAPRQLVRGDLEVVLNHPASRTHELQFNGFVR